MPTKTMQKKSATEEPQPAVLLHVHIQRPQGPGTILEHLSRCLGEINEDGFTYAQALAHRWLDMALDGNLAALKEILVRLAPVEEPGSTTIRYVLQSEPNVWGDEDPMPAA